MKLAQTVLTELSDEQAILQVLAGQTQVYGLLVQRYESSVRATLRVRLPNAHEAEDLSQETFLLAYEKLGDFELDSSFGAWLRGIGINLLRNHLRKSKAIAVGGNAELEQLVNDHIEQHFSESNEAPQLEGLRDCLTKLNDKMRVLLTEHYGLGKSLSELCKTYNDKHSAMTMRLFRVRQKLKACVEKSMGNQTL
jgi:RNA polymerase sigma-70 factor (ECF subfamily)